MSCESVIGHFLGMHIPDHRRCLKDLASLDKVASRLCTPRERLHFVKLYLGKRRFEAEAKQLIRDTLNYPKRRWPDDWNEH